MEGCGDTRIEPVESAWEREARRVRRLAARRRVALDEERLLLCDIREVMTLRHHLEQAPRRDARRLVRALARWRAWWAGSKEGHNRRDGW